MQVTFFKYHGAGNDFVLIDNRTAPIALTTEQIRQLCSRHFGIGADGLMLLDAPKHEGDHFYMTYYNSDGHESTMCGNGGRCIARFATDLGISADQLRFHAIDGPHWAEVLESDVRLGMIDAGEVVPRNGGHFVDTGSPHHVVRVDAFSEEFVQTSRDKRDEYGTEGSNVNEIVVEDEGLKIRTYERGVEDETLACGTGAVGAAMVAAAQGWAQSPVKVQALGGLLEVQFDGAGPFSNVVLKGPAEFVFKGQVEV